MNSADEVKLAKIKLLAKHLADVSQENVYNVSQGIPIEEMTVNIGEEVKGSIQIDKEVANLINWLAKEQRISPELALKKAVINAAYIHDITTNQGDKLLVQNKDNSISEIVLK